MSHYDFFDATGSISTDLALDHTPCFNRDTHVLNIYVSGKKITLDVRSLLHHAGCIDRQSRKGTTKLAVRQGRFAGIEQRNDEFVATSGRTVIGSFSNVTDAALARARWDEQDNGKISTPARQSDRKRRRVDYSERSDGESENGDEDELRKVTRVADDAARTHDENPEETREFVQARQNEMWKKALAADKAADKAADNAADNAAETTDENEHGTSDVELLGKSTLSARNAVGFSMAIDVDAL